jgi:hypothetical protein
VSPKTAVALGRNYLPACRHAHAMR